MKYSFVLLTVTVRWLVLTSSISPATATKKSEQESPPLSRCKEGWYDQRLDHFRWNNVSQSTFKQRYYICDDEFDPAEGAIFFYAGNEGDVTAYVNNTGLMWENAKAFKALLVFIEHRYYGQTQPFGPDSYQVNPEYLSTEQALADYAEFLYTYTNANNLTKRPVIAFGGSYGGMLAAWLRLKYPHLVDMAVASSAPMGGFMGTPGFKPSNYWKVVTNTAEAGSPPGWSCAAAVGAAFQALFEMSNGTADQKQAAISALGMCDDVVLRSTNDVWNVGYWLQGAYDTYAMGNYPFPSNYLTGDAILPAWPMAASCQAFYDSLGGKAASSSSPIELLAGIKAAIGVLYNATQDVSCYEPDLSGPAAGNSGAWDYQFCTEMMPQELPYFPAHGPAGGDMFWEQGPFNLSAIRDHCRGAWGVSPSLFWSSTEYGAYSALSQSSHIIFANGNYDPWSVFGLLTSLSDTLVAVPIDKAAHHVDLMFSTPQDPPSLRKARRQMVGLLKTWVPQAAAARASPYKLGILQVPMTATA